MKIKNTNISMETSLKRIAIGTALILMLPLVSMQITREVNWDLADFIVAGILLFVAGFGIDFFIRQKSKNMNKALMGIAILIGMLWLWVELAVGLFTNWGS